VAFDHYISGAARMYQGDLPGAIDILSRGLDVAAGPNVRLDLLLVLGISSGVAGDQERSLQCNHEILRMTEGTGECFHRSYALWALALSHFQRGELADAADLARQSLLLRSGLDDRMGTFWSLESLAWILGASGDHERAATLLGASSALMRSMGSSLAGFQHLVPYHDACDREARGALGHEAFREAFEHGEELEGAVAYALVAQSRAAPRTRPGPRAPRAPRAPRSPRARRGATSPLTPRKQEVAGFIAEGLSNREIADRLVISQRTAETHVANVLAKLGFTSRTQVAVWLAESREDE
jgi:DNA-binding CsgD family transcriptional regulator